MFGCLHACLFAGLVPDLDDIELNLGGLGSPLVSDAALGCHWGLARAASVLNHLFRSPAGEGAER